MHKQSSSSMSRAAEDPHQHCLLALCSPFHTQVTKKLVMNMDHYCPWMANAIGYGNYRYFFLVSVLVPCSMLDHIMCVLKG
jgi:hypothetical protein